MAAWADLAPRVEALEAAGVKVGTSYRGNPPRWLRETLGTCDAFVVNCKGVTPNTTVVMVKLADYERLIAAANGGTDEAKSG